MITSSSNELIKSIRKLRDKRYRSETGLAFIEGTKIVIDAINQGAQIEKLVISQTFAQSEKRAEIVGLLNSYLSLQSMVSDDVFASISIRDNPQGIGAVIRQSWVYLDQLEKLSGLWVGLLEVADPGNLGTIMRTVDAVGAKGIILIGNCTDPYDPGAIRASMGALFKNLIIKTGKLEFMDWVNQNQICVIGTADSAETNYREIIYPRDMILMMGSERQGLAEEFKSLCRDTVSIPMRGISDSLNLAVSTGVILYEIFQQHCKVTG